MGCFDRVVLDDGTSLEIRADEAHLAELANRFPHQREALAKFHHIANVVMLSFPLFVISRALPAGLSRWFSRWFLGPWKHWGGKTSRQVMEQLFDDVRLQALICGQWQDTGTRPDTGTFWLTASVFRGLAMEGAAYPRGGSEEIAKALVSTIEKHGGQVLVRCPVSQVCLEPATLPSKHRVTGVALSGKWDGVVIPCETVVSSAGFYETMGDGDGYQGMLGDASPSSNTVKGLEGSNGFVMCNVSMEGGTKEELGLTAANLWYQPCMLDNEKGIFDMCRDFFNDPDVHPSPMLITFPSMKDTSWVESAENVTRHTAQILILAKPEWFSDKNGGLKDEHRSTAAPVRTDKYTQYKQRWEHESLEVLRKLFPRIDELAAAGKLTLTADVSTPLSIQHYLAKCRGQATGLDSAPARFTDDEIGAQLGQETCVEGLWMTGQDTLICGQPLVQMSGVITALRVMGPIYTTRFLFNAARVVLHRLVYC
eukprot:TRINITY_DN44497_c0_g1_i2.p1 TRINITY_DN44497_c0_g1~~TRINITY_DN44497_c0_g1_i2.p1  ORF type:complete len:482 (+),score=90.59 TRINITY_DN44497_c0_g1_i2:238-1683(+)